MHKHFFYIPLTSFEKVYFATRIPLMSSLNAADIEVLSFWSIGYRNVHCAVKYFVWSSIFKIQWILEKTNLQLCIIFFDLTHYVYAYINCWLISCISNSFNSFQSVWGKYKLVWGISNEIDALLMKPK